MHRLGVLGWPVAHSRSPVMHNAALAALGLKDWTYQRLPVPPELFAETTRALPGAGFVGANVTIPHKHAALALADDASPAARAIGAANTLQFRDGRIVAENTDAPGLLRALPWSPEGRTALVLGAGGSARAAAWALREAGADVAVVNRTAARARTLAADLGVRVLDAAAPADLLVNCTSVGLGTGALKDLPACVEVISRSACAVDLVYRGGDDTAFIATARRAGREVVDGLEILIHQGALSLQLWTGTDAPIEVMRAAARQGRPPPPP